MHTRNSGHHPNGAITGQLRKSENTDQLGSGLHRQPLAFLLCLRYTVASMFYCGNGLGRLQWYVFRARITLHRRSVSCTVHSARVGDDFRISWIRVRDVTGGSNFHAGFVGRIAIDG